MGVEVKVTQGGGGTLPLPPKDLGLDPHTLGCSFPGLVAEESNSDT